MSALRQAVAGLPADPARARIQARERRRGCCAQFVDYLDALGPRRSPSSTRVRWATLPAAARARYRAKRLASGSRVRPLPADDRPGRRGAADRSAPRPAAAAPDPYIYSDAEIVALMAAAGRWRPRLGCATMQTLIGLLAVTGMRIGEAIAARPRRPRPRARAARSSATASSASPASCRCTRPPSPALRDYLRVRDRAAPAPSRRRRC